ncbi:hypothetical protein X739_31395 [Mesorhizobium sp. LNHC220B00]|nr:hypothetical protein X739_31395 [Mesorhizobium sp. LNHC220B00]ESY88236.1 hypothetical protein X741_31700 [Mesorhizobium sp. LNHC229A00]
MLDHSIFDMNFMVVPQFSLEDFHIQAFNREQTHSAKFRRVQQRVQSETRYVAGEADSVAG